MNIHYDPKATNGYHRVIGTHSPEKQVQPAIQSPFITIDETENTPLYWDVCCHPGKYLVNEAGELFVDEDWSADDAY